MTTHALQRTTVLVLNRHWLAIDSITPAEAFGHLATGSARALLLRIVAGYRPTADVVDLVWRRRGAAEPVVALAGGNVTAIERRRGTAQGEPS